MATPRLALASISNSLAVFSEARKEIGSFFSGHDARNSSDTEHITFLVPAAANQFQGFGFHQNPAFGHSSAGTGRFFTDVDHVSFASGIEMCKFTHTNCPEVIL
jgi:hypothetical protein